MKRAGRVNRHCRILLDDPDGSLPADTGFGVGRINAPLSAPAYRQDPATGRLPCAKGKEI
jgi:hypothetical protein